MTISEKILAAHSGKEEIQPGEFIEADIDVALANDITAPMSPIKTIRDIKAVDVPVSGVSLGNLKFDEKTDIWAIAASSVGTAAVEVNYDFLQYGIGQ